MVGHYTIAGAAGGWARRAPHWRGCCSLTATASPSVISRSLPANRLTPERAGAFVPLADVPDLVWRRTRPKDAANHFAPIWISLEEARLAGRR
jgi:hypothetical protein